MASSAIRRVLHRGAARSVALAGAGFLVFATPDPAPAHHSFAMFDQTKRVTIQGVVTKFQWINPHVYLHINGKDGKGSAVRLVFEGGSVNMLTRNGWKPASIKAGDMVVVDYYPLRNGNPGGAVQSVKLPNGKVLKTW